MRSPFAAYLTVRHRRRAAAVVAVMTTAALVVMTPPSARAALDPVCAQPVVREAMVSQGLPSYASLARGKSTLVKFFLSLPQGCDPAKQYVTVTGGQMSVLSSLGTTASVALPTESFGPVTAFTTAPSSSSTGNPTFLVTGEQLGPTGAGAPYTSAFTATISYEVTEVTATGSRITYPTQSFVTGTVSREVDVAANPLRVLLVPIGDERRRFSENLPSEAVSMLHSAMTSLNRLLPVADGVGRLSGTGGVRYDIAPSDSLVDVGPHDHDFDPSTPEVDWIDPETKKYCPSAGHFSYIAAKLAMARQKWNESNKDAPASRVLGVLWQDVSLGASTDDETPGVADGSCIEGYADVAGTVGWARIIDPHPGNVAQSTGSIAGMEVLHTLGAVPNSLSGFHSLNAQADGTAPDRGYDLLRRSHIAKDRSLMRYFYDAWHDDITLSEPPDWTQAACVLSSTPAQSLSAAACSKAGTVGALAAASADHVHLAGVTDGTRAGTDAHTYVGTSRAAQSTDPTSPFQLVYYGPRNPDGSLGPELGRSGVRVTFEHSEHSSDADDEPINDTDATPTGVFDVAVVPVPGTEEFALVKAGTPDVVLYGRAKDDRPVIESVERGVPLPSVPVVRYADGPSGDPFPPAAVSEVSDDGELVAWESGGDIAVRRSDDSTSPPLLIPGGRAPSFAHTRDALVYTDAAGAQLRIADLDTSGPVPRLLGETVVYRSDLDASGVPAQPVFDPSLSPDDTRVVVASGTLLTSQLYVIDTAGDCPVLGGPSCLRLTTLGGAHDPAWSVTTRATAPDGVIAFQDTTPYDGGSSSSIAVINPAFPNLERTVVLEDAAAPEWGGSRLAYFDVDDATITTVAATTYADPQPAVASNGHPSLSLDDTLLSFSAEETVAGAPVRSAIYVARLGRSSERVVEVTDDHPENLRLDVVAVCPTGVFPLHTYVFPTVTSDGGAAFEVDVETEPLCPGARVRYDVTDGFQIAEPFTEGPAADAVGEPAVGITAPRDGDTALQHRSVPLALNGRNAAGEPVDVAYTVTGPTGELLTGTVPAGGRTDLPPFAAPGVYAVTASVTDETGTATAAASFTVLEDKDADGVPAILDSRAVNSCLPENADQEPLTAVLDPDGDFEVGPDDASLCVSSLNASVDFDANTLNSASSGTTVTLYVTSRQVDLRRFTQADVAIDRLDAHPVHLPALAWSIDKTGRATAKFDRQLLQSRAAKLGLTGYVRVRVSGATTGATFSGIDPQKPFFQ
jgi:hypothetical protein